MEMKQTAQAIYLEGIAITVQFDLTNTQTH